MGAKFVNPLVGDFRAFRRNADLNHIVRVEGPDASTRMVVVEDAGGVVVADPQRLQFLVPCVVSHNGRVPGRGAGRGLALAVPVGDLDPAVVHQAVEGFGPLQAVGGEEVVHRDAVASDAHGFIVPSWRRESQGVERFIYFLERAIHSSASTCTLSKNAFGQSMRREVRSRPVMIASPWM